MASITLYRQVFPQPSSGVVHAPAKTPAGSNRCLHIACIHNTKVLHSCIHNILSDATLWTTKTETDLQRKFPNLHTFLSVVNNPQPWISSVLVFCPFSRWVFYTCFLAPLERALHWTSNMSRQSLLHVTQLHTVHNTTHPNLILLLPVSFLSKDTKNVPLLCYENY